MKYVRKASVEILSISKDSLNNLLTVNFLRATTVRTANRRDENLTFELNEKTPENHLC